MKLVQAKKTLLSRLVGKYRSIQFQKLVLYVDQMGSVDALVTVRGGEFVKVYS